MTATARLCLIAAMDRHRLIGVDSERMPWHLSEDLRHFKRTTLGRPVIMGRKTHTSIGRVLPGRLNIVLTRGQAVTPVPGQLAAACDLGNARQLAGRWLDEHPDAPREVFVIGGADVYAQSIEIADRLVLTEIDASFEGNNHFPAFRDMQPGWTELHRETHRAGGSDNFDYAFVTYQRAT